MKTSELPIASPCTADWRTMTPAGGGRFCADCKKVVRDLSRMRERDARTLLQSGSNGALCVRYLYDRHGRIFFAGDRGQPLVPASLLQRAKRVARSAAAIAVPLSLAACSPSASGATPSNDEPQQHHEDLIENMGAPPELPRPDASSDAATDAQSPDGGDGGDAGVGDGGADAPAVPEPPI